MKCKVEIVTMIFEHLLVKDSHSACGHQEEGGSRMKGYSSEDQNCHGALLYSLNHELG